MTSLRNRLLLILVAATCLIWMAAIFWVYAGSKPKFDHALDNRLREAASMVLSLVANNAPLTVDSLEAPAKNATYERQLSCQIWSLDGRMIAHSRDAPRSRLAATGSGFADRLVDGRMWRVYSIDDEEKGVRVMVGDSAAMRERLAASLVAGLAVPALLAIPALALIVWLSLGLGLRPLIVFAEHLRERASDDMTRVEPGDAPSEVRPLIDAVNDLLTNLEGALRHDRELTAFAAHELRTPIAGLKTHAQIALAAADPTVKEGALRQILVSVDRTTRLIRQLLTLSKLDAANPPECDEEVNVGEVLDEIVGAAEYRNEAATVEIDSELRKVSLNSNREILTVALRNLHENALQYVPDSGSVRWRLESAPCGIVIEDEGPGMPEDELPRASERFFRGRHRSATGTGLGLAIVKLAASRLGGKLVLANRPERPGFKASLFFKTFSRNTGQL